MLAGRWTFLLALALMATDGVAFGENVSLPPCPGGADPGAIIFRDGCQARVRYGSGVYIGEFRQNIREGKGVWIYPNGAKYAGGFKDGKPSGRGTYNYPNGSKYVGDFRDGKFNGSGVLYGADGAVMSSGYFSDDKFVGSSTTNAQAPPSTSPEPPPPLGQKSIRLTLVGEQNVVPITLNGIVTLDAFVDSGASAIVIPADAFAKLENNHTIASEDYLGMTKVFLANGSESEARVFRIHSLKVGEVKVYDVLAVVGTKQSPTLLGQSFLRKFKSWSIDNRRHTLNLD